MKIRLTTAELARLIRETETPKERCPRLFLPAYVAQCIYTVDDYACVLVTPTRSEARRDYDALIN